MNRFSPLMSLSLAVPLVLGLCGCEYREDVVSIPTMHQEVTSSPYRIALVTPGQTISDQAFNQGVWDGVRDFSETSGVPADYYQPAASTDLARARSIQLAVKDGANIIVLPGFAYPELMGSVTAQYPNVDFIAIDVDPAVDFSGTTPPDNLFCISFAEEQSGYLAGYGVVRDGYTKLGFLGGKDIPSVVNYGQGFIQGIDAAAKELRCPVEVNYTYSGQFSGDDAITAHMYDWYKSGTEVIFSCGGAIWVSPMEAAMYHNGMVIGVDTDQHHLGDNTKKYAYNPIVTSALKAMDTATMEALGVACSGQFDTIGGTCVSLGLSDGDYVGLPTEGDSWGFRSFSIYAYERVKDKLARGEILVDDDHRPDFHFQTSEYTTVNYDA